MPSICIAETRESEIIAVKFLLLSLKNHCPEILIHLFVGSFKHDFEKWATENNILLELREPPNKELCNSWNIKVYAIDMLLSEGIDGIWWIDSDVIVNGNFISEYSDVETGQIIVCEEALYGRYRDDGYRARAWGLPVKRTFISTLNTAVLKIDQTHKPLIAEWKKLIEREEYVSAQSKTTDCREFHLLSDQDVLTAILCSDLFWKIPVKILRRGGDIIQYFGSSGYTVRERFKNIVFGLPNFIHSQGRKPWSSDVNAESIFLSKQYFFNVLLEVSPYLYVARQYEDQFDYEIEWLYPRSLLGRLLSNVSFNSAAMAGAPLAIVIAFVRVVKMLVGRDNRFNPKRSYEKLGLSG